MQLDRLYYVIRAWGAGGQSWLVTWGKAFTWTELEEAIIHRRFEGRIASVRQAFIDSHYRTGEVYDWAHKWGGQIMPVKGSNWQMRTPFMPHRVDRDPGTTKLAAGGLHYYELNGDFYRDSITVAQERGLWKVPRVVDKEYARQVTSECKVMDRNSRGQQRLVWKLKAGASSNHYWDCEVYAMAGAQINYADNIPGDAPARAVPVRQQAGPVIQRGGIEIVQGTGNLRRRY